MDEERGTTEEVRHEAGHGTVQETRKKREEWKEKRKEKREEKRRKKESWERKGKRREKREKRKKRKKRKVKEKRKEEKELKKIVIEKNRKSTLFTVFSNRTVRNRTVTNLFFQTQPNYNPYLPNNQIIV